MRESMRRSTAFSGTFSLLRTAFSGAFVLAAIFSCSDSTAPAVKADRDPALDGITVVHFNVADALKHSIQPVSGSASLSVPQSANKTLLVTSAKASLSASAASYTVSSLPSFNPERAPSKFLMSCDDCVAYDTPIGFDFTFYGNTYSKLHVGANGFVGFDRSIESGCCEGGEIPSSDDPTYNNMIAVAWTDLNSGVLNSDIRYETEGSAPDRKLVIQWNNVPEYYNGLGRVTAQLVLSEGSNDITINTFSENVSNQYHAVTQGIENADGTEAAFVDGRVHAFFTLSNDAVRFSPSHVVANEPPVLVAPPNIDVTTTPPTFALGVGLCTAKVNPGLPTVTDDADGVTTNGVRSDDAVLPLVGDYPKGVTTIAWTATDAGGLTASGSQTVTVRDNEKPLVSAPAAVSVRTDRGKNTATVSVVAATAQDNCPNVTVAGARGDGAELSAAYPIGLTTITWTATDQSGNSSSASQSINVHANLAPIVTAPASFAVNTDAGVCNALANIGVASVTDDDIGSTVQGRRSDGALLSAAYPKGITTITWIATDADGLLSAPASQTVTVNDGERPSVTAPADISTGNTLGLASAVVAVGRATAQDNCRDVTVNGARNDGAALDAPYNVGVTTIVWTARDLAGNSAAASQRITVRDVDAPVITVPAPISADATSPAGALVNYSVSFSDNVAVMNHSCSPASGSTFAVGPNTVSCSASDAAGNTATKTFTVTVVGARAQEESLIAWILRQNLPNGATNPLVNQVRAALSATDISTSCTKMSDFLHMVAVKSASLTDAQETYMSDAAAKIMGAMGCS
jgi:hypothetical protein